MATPTIRSICPSPGVTSGGSVSWNHSYNTAVDNDVLLVWICCGSPSYTSGSRYVQLSSGGYLNAIGAQQGSNMAIELFAAVNPPAFTSMTANFSGIGTFVRSVCTSQIITNYYSGGPLQSTTGTGNVASQTYQSKPGGLALNVMACNGNPFSGYNQTSDLVRAVGSSGAPQVILGHTYGEESPVTFSANKDNSQSWVSLAVDIWAKQTGFFSMY